MDDNFKDLNIEKRVSEYVKATYTPPVRYSTVLLPDEYFDIRVKNTIEKGEKLDEVIKPSFVDGILEYMIEKDLKSTEVYKNAHIDRKLFSKIMSDRTYKPSKDTCVALILALKLDKDGVYEMLNRAGYSLSHSIERDIIIEYFFVNEIYDIDTVNDVLEKFGQNGLGM